MTTTRPEVRDRLALVLDVEDLDVAAGLARRLAPWFAIAKVGFELYGTAGPEAFERLHGLGYRVFADLKLFDIPTTVERGARTLARHGLAFLNAHAAGGDAMLRAFVHGASEGARDAGVAPPVTLAVTVLTSEADSAASRAAFDDRLASARRARCDGVVCAAIEARRARDAGLRAMVAGVRLPGGDQHDQARVASPGAALAAGAEWLVIGRAVTAANDPEEAAELVSRAAAAGCSR